MKRIVILLCSLLGLTGLVLMIASLATPGPHTPRFVPLHSQPVGTFTWMGYDWGGAVPIQGGMLWVQTRSSSTNHHCFLYDVTNRLVVGELFNASPVFFNQDQTKLLCEGGSLEAAWKWKLVRWLETQPLGKGLAQKMNRPEVFWILNLKNGAARPVGHLAQAPGSGSRFLPSPGFRYGLNQPSTSAGAEWFLCDLESNLFTKLTLGGQVAGWWDAQNLLVKDPGNNFVLFDVVTHQTHTLFSVGAMARFLEQFELPHDPSALGTVSAWNDHEYEFFFTLAQQKWSGESFLLKAERATKALKLVKRNFQFQHLGRLDAEGTHYLYQGESGASGRGGNGGVYLRDLSDDSVRTLVEPDHRGQYALARFCGDGVIYSRNRLLFRVDLNGSNNAPLLQPGEKQ